MKTEQEVNRQLVQQSVLPLFYHNQEAGCVKTITALYSAGIRNIEFTNRGANAPAILPALLRERDANLPGMLIGVGTIRNAEDAKYFIQAGADFLVSPFFDSGVADAAYLNKVFWIPGCTTCTEIHVAEQAGCKLVKLFPGSLLKPAYIKAIKPIFPDMQFMVTGGVKTSEGSMQKWLKAGANILGLGSNFISNDMIDNQDFDTMESNARQVLMTIETIRHS